VAAARAPWTRTEEHFIQIGRHRLRVAVHAPGRGRPLLLINGLGGNVESWGGIVDALASGRELISFDAPGTGLSSTPRLPLSMTGLARLAMGLVESLGHERVDVLGLSMGGGVAQTMARRWPRRVRSLVLVATACGWGGVPGNPVALGLLSTPYRYYSSRHYRAVAPILFGGGVRRSKAVLNGYISSRTARPPSVAGYLWQLAALSTWSSLPWLCRLRHPALIIAGDDDPLIPVWNAHLMAALMPRADLRVIRGGGHLLLFEETAAVAAHIDAFLRTLDGQAGASP
jgi:poly(3-hydroxyalkanoate) depolymerase